MSSRLPWQLCCQLSSQGWRVWASVLAFDLNLSLLFLTANIFTYEDGHFSEVQSRDVCFRLSQADSPPDPWVISALLISMEGELDGYGPLCSHRFLRDLVRLSESL